MIVDLVSDIIFLFDIVINFNSVEEDKNGNYIFDRRQIAVMYTKSWFFIDAISSFPLSIFLLIFQTQQPE